MITLSHMRKSNNERKKMKITKILQKVVKKEGKHSHVANVVVKYKDSKEFSYLIDINR